MRPSSLRHPVVAYRRARLLPAWVRRMDAAAGQHINNQHAHSRLDTGYRRISRAADRGRLWFAIAGGLALVGRDRAALRGIASLLTASLLANLVGKKVFGGDRPIVADIPIGRQLRAYPTSASFPSGHSASAAAFATGVALESRGAGLLVAPLAAAVAYSRLHVGAHWLSDVLGGATLGAGVALLGRVIVPARIPTAQPIPGSGTAIELPALGDGAGVLITINASSGTDVVRIDPRLTITRRLPRARLHELQPEESIDQVVAEALASDDPPRVLGVCGGDGSVSAMAHLARRHRLPFLVLPGGTFNHFARAAGVTSVGVGIDALQAGTGLRVSVGDLELADEPRSTVLNAASIGIYPEFLVERERRQRALGKWLAGVVAAVRVLQGARPVQIERDGKRATVWSVFVSIGRNNPRQIATMQRRSLDDDVLDVRLLHARGPRWRAVLAMAFGQKTAAVLRVLHLLPRSSDVESFTTERLGITVRPNSGEHPGFTHDGELETDPAGATSRGYHAELTAVADALEVYAPRFDV